jgi:hypothetical protein
VIWDLRSKIYNPLTIVKTCFRYIFLYFYFCKFGKDNLYSSNFSAALVQFLGCLFFQNPVFLKFPGSHAVVNIAAFPISQSSRLFPVKKKTNSLPVMLQTIAASLKARTILPGQRSLVYFSTRSCGKSHAFEEIRRFILLT